MRVFVRAMATATLVLSLGFLAGMARFAAIGEREAAAPGTTPRAIAVLTGGGGARLQAAGALMAEHRRSRLLVSGVDQASAADLAALLSMAPADFDDRVSIGRIARDTVGNAREVAAWADAEGHGDVLIVTSDYHMARALLEIRRRAPHLVLRPHPVSVDGARLADWWRDPRAFRRVAPEFLKFAAVWSRTALFDPPPAEKDE